MASGRMANQPVAPSSIVQPVPPLTAPDLNLDSLQVRRRGLALLATFEIEADLLALIEPGQAGTLDRRNMDEDVLRSIIRLNEAVSFLRIEPFHSTF
jgi:hypothetical protein